MKNQKEYWKDIIIEWENDSYELSNNKSISCVEKAAHLFRGPVRYRPVIALKVINEKKPRNVLELGCGSGRLALKLAERTDIEHITGIDIAEPAIEAAKKLAKELNLEDKVTFISSSINDIDFDSLPEFDFVFGLGLTPYLTDSEFNHLFKAVKDKMFMFDFHPKGISLSNIAHSVYRKIKGHPFYYQYSKSEVLEKMKDLGITNVSWSQEKGVYYIKKR